MLILGTISIPDYFVVDNSNLMRNYFFSLISIVLLATRVILGKLKYIKVNKLSMYVFCGLAIAVIRNPCDTYFFTCAISFIFLVIILNTFNTSDIGIAKCIIIACVLETFVCYIQVFGIVENSEVYNLILGTFENPNTYGVFASLCFPFIILLSRQPHYRYLCLSLIYAIIILLLLMKCRSSLVCLFLSYVILNRRIKSILNRNCLLPILVMLLLVCFWEYKSSLGRLLIFLTSSRLLLHMPYWGYGKDGFTKFYMTEQSEVLSKFDYFVGVEGNPMKPLNEYISYILNVGPIGLILLTLFLYSFIRGHRSYNIVFYSCLINIVFLSLFQNCMTYSFVWLFAALSLSQINEKFTYLNLTNIRYLFMGTCIVCLYLIIKDFSFEFNWKKTYDKVCADPFNLNYIDNYEKLYKEWNGNPYFLYNYASVLHLNENYDRSNQLLNHYSNYVVDYQGTLLKAENLLKMDKFNLAVVEFKISHKMCPSRFAPLWGCLQCYSKINQKEYIKTAKLIRDKKVKVDSYNIQLMKKYSEDIINEKGENENK